MEKAISAAGATRRFSELLRSVKQGRSFIITSQGRPVARLTPVSQIGLRIAPARAARGAEVGVTNPFAPVLHPLLAGLVVESLQFRYADANEGSIPYGKFSAGFV